MMPTVARSLVTIATALMGAADGLMVGQAPRPATEHACTASSRPETLGRRAVASLLGGAMGAALMRPPSAYADTQAMLSDMRPTESDLKYRDPKSTWRDC